MKKRRGFKRHTPVPWAGAKPRSTSIARPTNVFRKPRKRGYGV